jgi:hypothetical protein
MIACSSCSNEGIALATLCLTVFEWNLMWPGALSIIALVPV